MTLQIPVKLLVAVVKHIREKLGLAMIWHLAKSSHERSDLAVVGRIHVRAGMHQKLDHIKMTAVCRQPERSVSFLVSYVDVGAPAQRDEGVKPKAVVHHLFRSAVNAHLLISSSQNL